MSTPPDPADAVAAWRARVQQRIAGRPWIATSDMLVGAAAQAQVLLDLGASRVLAIGGARGAGALPDPQVIAQIELGTGGTDMMGVIRAAEAALADVSPAVQAQVDVFDPAGEAQVVAALFSSGAPVAGRKVYGARPASWQALEDKVTVDALWDAAGVERAPAAVVAAEPAALAAAAAALDGGQGTVWAGDAREGFNGGASYVRWVRSNADAVEATAFFGPRCDRVRVMPFLAGVPCSIHGIVLPDTVLALRPCEMLVFQVPGQSRFAYAGAGTFWDPPAADREAMRAAVRRVGAHLRTTVGYRGVFTLDGVMTPAGFRPTELNPRYGAALGILAAALPGMPLYLLHLALVEGEPLGPDAADLEALLVTTADRHRRGSGHQLLQKKITESETLTLVRTDAGWRVAHDGEAAHATLMLGPNPLGGFLRATLDPAATPVGPSAAPRLAEVFAFADHHWALGLGPLAPSEGAA